MQKSVLVHVLSYAYTLPAGRELTRFPTDRGAAHVCGRYKQNTNNNYNGTVKRLLRWCEEKGVDAEPLCTDAPRTTSTTG